MHIPRLSSLKPLPPPPPQVNSYSTQGIKLLQKAITTSTASEKNDLLNEVHKLWPTMSNEFDEAIRSNKEKEKQLKNLQDRLNKAEQDKKNLQENSDFYKLAPQHAKKHEKAKYMEGCQKLQSEIMRFTTIPPLARFEERLKTKCINEQITSFALQDEMIHHLEQLAYELNKRKIIVEQSGESSETINSEFGSLNGLLSKYNELLEENEKLKAEETKFACDPMTKRRKFDNFSCHSSRMLVDTIKDIVESELDIAHFFEAPKEVEEGMDFDTLVPSQDEKVLNMKLSFSDLQYNLSSSQIITQGNLAKQQELLQDYKKTVEKLEDEVRGGTKRSYTSDASSLPHNRADKVLDANFALIDKIDGYVVDIDNKNAQIDVLVEKLTNLTKDRKEVYEKYWKILKQYQDLVNSHVDLSNVLNKNRTILSSLLTVVNSFGSDMINLIPQDTIKQYMDKEISIKSNDIQNGAPMPIVKMHEENEENGKRRNLKRARNSSASVEQFTHLESHCNCSNLLTNKMEIINALSLACQIGGFSVGSDKKLHDPIRFMNNHLIGGISETSKEQLGQVMQFFKENLTKLRMTSNLILIREKNSLATQTDELDRKNEETMTDEPSKKPGKK